MRGTYAHMHTHIHMDAAIYVTYFASDVYTLSVYLCAILYNSDFNSTFYCLYIFYNYKYVHQSFNLLQEKKDVRFAWLWG